MAVSIAAKKENTASVVGKHKFLSGSKGSCILKNLDETVHLQFNKKEEWIQQVKGERLQGTAKGRSSAPYQASSSAALFPGRNECPGSGEPL